MNNTIFPTRTMTEGVLLGTPDQLKVGDSQKIWTLGHSGRSLACMIPSTELVSEILNRPLTTYMFPVLQWPSNREAHAATAVPIVTHAHWLGDFDVLRHLPDNLCPVEGVLASVVDLIDSIRIEPLHDFVQQAFQQRDVNEQFWTMPASGKHHHAFPGGLAAHTLEVARDLANQSSLEDHERELAIAAGLLHDIGKVWSYTDDMFPNTASRAMGHELIGLSRLEEPLKLLERAWPDGAYAMRVLLNGSGRMRRDGTMPSALVARLRAADQRSCEQDRTKSKVTRVWVPKAWSAPRHVPTLVPNNEPHDVVF